VKPDRWRQIDELFDAALERDPTQRAAFLDGACAEDPSLRREVESLLAAHERAGSFIETPASDSQVDLGVTGARHVTVGGRIGHYEIISALGAGGMGEVFLARDISLERNVSIKLLHETLTDNSQARARFLREAQLAATLDHPNICTIHEIGEDQGQCFIAMQYVEGRTLKQLMASQPLSVKNLLAASLQIADALSAAHDKAIIHRDIKSTNIIVTPRGQVKVLDFGLAKLMDEATLRMSRAETELTHSGMILGTPAYMSPEQARGERTDHRSDIFSFGVLMYEMATGQLPFRGKSQPETLNAIINESHKPVSQSNRDVPTELASIIDCSMAKAPGRRYQSIGELKDDLSRVAQSLGVSGSSLLEDATVPYVTPSRSLITRITRLSRVRSGRRLAVVGLAALVLGLALFLVFRILRSGDVTNPTAIGSLAVMPLLNVSGNADLDYLADGITDSVINNLSRVSNLRVMSHSSVFRYKGKEIDPQTTAGELKVQAVALGQLVSHGDSISINLEMVDPRDNHQIWGQRYDRKLSEIIQLSSDISRDIASKLLLKPSSEEQKMIAKLYTENNAAYQLYLQGRFYLDRRSTRDIKTGLGCFEQATRIDPNYALAYAGLAEAYDSLINFPSDQPAKEFLSKANRAAARAVELDDALAEAHLALGYALWNDIQNGLAYDAVEREFRRAVDLNPNLVPARRWYAAFLAEVLRTDDAISQIKRAVEIDPLAPFNYRVYAQILYFGRRYDEAIEQCKKALELDPHFRTTYGWLEDCYEMKGLYVEACATHMKLLAVSGTDFKVVEALTGAYQASGWRGFWQKVMELESKRNDQPAFGTYTDVAKEHLRIGENDEAIRWLQKAVAESDPITAGLKCDPFWDGIRADPRFQDLVQRVGVPH